MTTLMTILEAIAVFLVGLALRLALLVAVLAAVATPVLLALLGLRNVRELWRRVRGPRELAGLPWRSGLLHSAGHLWLEPGGSGLKLGLDGLAHRLLPGVQRVALPMAGAEVHRGEPIAEIVTASRRVPIPAPVDGTITEINRGLQRHPERLEKDPYRSGWLVRLRPQARDTSRFLTGDLAVDWFKGESARLARHFEQELGVAAADGGEPLLAPERALTKEQWQRLAEAFLSAS